MNQTHQCQYFEEIHETGRLVRDIHEALLGTMASPEKGICHRVQVLESWRTSQATRQKSRFALFASAIGGILVWLLSMVAKPIMRMMGVQ